MLPTWLFQFLCIVGFVGQIVNLWLLSKGKIVYPLIILIYANYVGIESTLAMNDPSQRVVFLFALLNVYGMAMGFRGLLRVRREKNEKLS